MELAHSPSSCNRIRLQAKPSIQQRQIGPHLSHLQTPLFPRSQQPFPAFHQTACKQVRAAQQKRQKEGTDPRTHALTGVAEVLAPPAKDGTRNVLSTRVGEQRQRLLAKRGGARDPGYLSARTGASSWASPPSSSRPGAWFEPSRWAPRTALVADGFDSELSGREGVSTVSFFFKGAGDGEMKRGAALW